LFINYAEDQDTLIKQEKGYETGNRKYNKSYSILNHSYAVNS